VTPRNEIAIYAPFASLFYEQADDKSGESPDGGGGAELQTAVLAAQLAKRGFRVAHIVYPVANPVPNPPVEVVQRRALDVHDRSGFDRFAELRPLWQALKAADAGAYVFRGGGSLAFLVGAAFCLVHRRALVLSASNDFDFLTRSDRSRIGQALSRLARRRANAVVVQTEQQARLARKSTGDEARVHVIRSFSDPGPPARHSESSDSFLWVGRTVPYKLPLEYAALARAMPDVRFRMVAPVIGESPADLVGEVAAADRELANLELLGHVWRESVLDLIDRAAAVVLTSEYEGMPNVFLEAWGRGVPVLSLHFDPDGVIAREGVGLFAEGSRERLVDEARRLWDDSDLRAEMGARGREYVARTHAPDVIGERWAQLLGEVLGK
jgi:glycosyltransferase involved in cell wall biosynthesis